MIDTCHGFKQPNRQRRENAGGIRCHSLVAVPNGFHTSVGFFLANYGGGTLDHARCGQVGLLSNRSRACNYL